jgi:catechol 2,3-dioxygenase-like lactoylglutathione lyase family enzyme
MPLTELNHYFVRANDIEKTKRFYCEALELTEMPRPEFPFPGYWLGRDGKIWVHMGPHGIEHANVHYRGSPSHAATDNAGVIDHIAFSARDPDEFRARLTRLNCDWWARSLPKSELFQIFVRDPDGLTIEINFFGLKGMPTWAEDYGSLPRVN